MTAFSKLAWLLIRPQRVACGTSANARSPKLRFGSLLASSAGPARRQTMGHSAHDPAVKGRPPGIWPQARRQTSLKPQQVWAIRSGLTANGAHATGQCFDLAIDSKLRGCDIVKLKIGDLVSGGRVRSRAIVIQRKTGRPVQFELLEPARTSILAWLEARGGTLDDYAFPAGSTCHAHQHQAVCALGR